MPLGTIAAIYRYPVKSMRGEPLPLAELTLDGLAHDRLYAFESTGAPPGMLRLTARERAALLLFRASHTLSGVRVTTPEGLTLPVDDPLLTGHFPAFTPTTLTLRATPQTDVRPLALISLQTVAELARELGTPLDPRRFRANLYLDLPAPFAEDALAGQTVRLGSTAVVKVLERTPRCRFITLDPDTADPMPALMQLLHRRHGSRAGVYARVLAPGAVRPGDSLDDGDQAR